MRQPENRESVFRLPEMFCVLRVFFITRASAVFQEGGSLS